MTELFACSLDTHPPDKHGRARHACAPSRKRSLRSFLDDCQQLLFPRNANTSRCGQNKDRGCQSKSAANSPLAALTDALNAEKGARAKAVHLTVVEQTLLQEISGGLDAIPADVLKHAISQLVTLSRYPSFPELMPLLHSMQQIAQAKAKKLAPHMIAERHDQWDLFDKRKSSLTTVTKVWAGPSRRLFMEPVECIANDDFPDTEAFSNDEPEIPIPTHQASCGSTEINSSYPDQD